MTGKNASGQPSKYNNDILKLFIEYFDVEPYEEQFKKIHTRSGDVIEIPMDVANDMPTLAGFAIQIGVHRDTLHQWSKAQNKDGSLKHPEFSDAYKRAVDYQEHYLVTNGLKNLVSTNFAIFTAKNILKWRDRQPDETDVVINNINGLSDAEIDAKIAAHEAKRGKK